jgi:hypothetical protein
MVKRLNLAFSEEEHENLKKNKEETRKKLGLNGLSWEKYFLGMSKKC